MTETPSPAEERIVLPRSGVVLTVRDGDLWLPAGLGKIGQTPVGDWATSYRGIAIRGTRDECIAWLDARVLETRAALNGSAILVPDSPETVDKITQTLWDLFQGGRYGRTTIPLSEQPETTRAGWRAHAIAVLSALREAQGAGGAG